jgi:hypothetical protein
MFILHFYFSFVLGIQLMLSCSSLCVDDRKSSYWSDFTKYVLDRENLNPALAALLYVYTFILMSLIYSFVDTYIILLPSCLVCPSLQYCSPISVWWRQHISLSRVTQNSKLFLLIYRSPCDGIVGFGIGNVS